MFKDMKDVDWKAKVEELRAKRAAMGSKVKGFVQSHPKSMIAVAAVGGLAAAYGATTLVVGTASKVAVGLGTYVVVDVCMSGMIAYAVVRADRAMREAQSGRVVDGEVTARA